MTDKSTIAEATLLVHTGRDRERSAGLVNTPVFRGSTVLFEDVRAYEERDPDDYKTMRYGVHGTPTTYAFEQAITELEGAHASVALPSGLAAITATLCAFVKAGDHLLMPDSAYGPARNFCERRLRPFGVDVEYYDPLLGAGIARLLRANTRLIYCESPGSLTFEVQDIPAIAAAAHARGIPVAADNTWATPLWFKPFAHGVDVSIHAGTKYILGHADALIGVISTTEKCWLQVRRTTADFGFCVSPDDCFLALRGLRTLGLRMRQQQLSARKIARWLQSRPEVRRVLYPALETDPGHAIWKRDFTGASSLFGAVLAPAAGESVAEMIESLRLFGISSSWGSFVSTAIRVVDLAKLRTATPWRDDGPVVRFHIGLEDPDDLIADLERGLAHLRPAHATPAR
ncbi:MAG TPA: cystathionine beta-lyase [Kofleriaceae bacterium]|jgi:cystathionine beta-lyase|nr:cystathionine beta-lyase [Kofleriaceae bacterium]